MCVTKNQVAYSVTLLRFSVPSLVSLPGPLHTGAYQLGLNDSDKIIITIDGCKLLQYSYDTIQGPLTTTIIEWASGPR